VCVCLYACVNMRECVCVYVHTCVCVRVCVEGGSYLTTVLSTQVWVSSTQKEINKVFVCVCMHACDIHILHAKHTLSVTRKNVAQTRTRTCTCTCAHTRTRTRTRLHARTHTHTHIHTSVSTLTLALRCTYITLQHATTCCNMLQHAATHLFEH